MAYSQGRQVQIALVGDLIKHGTKETTLRAAGKALMRKALKSVQDGKEMKEMGLKKHLATRGFLLLTLCLAIGALLALSACSGGGAGSSGGQLTATAPSSQPPAQAPATPKPAAQATQPPAQPASTAAAGGAQTSSSVEVDACKLLTKAEVESAVGRPLGEPVSRLTEYAEPSYASSCGYSAPGFEAFVNSTVFVGRDAAQAKELYQTHKKAAMDTASSVAPAAGVGEEAFWVDVSGNLTVLKGRYEVKVSVVNGGLEAVKGLASKMLERLP